jgi:hypothetical protein
LKQKIPGFQQPGESDAPRNISIGLGVNGEIQAINGSKVLHNSRSEVFNARSDDCLIPELNNLADNE